MVLFVTCGIASKVAGLTTGLTCVAVFVATDLLARSACAFETAALAAAVVEALGFAPPPDVPADDFAPPEKKSHNDSSLLQESPLAR
jgi:hypothetical protein